MIRTQCKIEITYASHCVSKNLTPRTVLKTAFLIAQIFGLGKVDRLAGKTYFVQKKKTPKTPIIMDNFSDRLTLEGAGGHTDDTKSTFRSPLKSLGYNGSN